MQHQNLKPMKKNFLPPTVILTTLILGSLFLPQKAQGGAHEMVIINSQVTYDNSLSGGNAFRHTVKPAQFPASWVNWESPYDYYNGTFYAYYEVISVPTNVAFKMQIGIFQYYPSLGSWDGHNFGETCSGTATLQGNGSVAYYSSSPSTWWTLNGGADFSRVDDFESVGPVLWGTNPDSPLITTNGGGNDATWAQKDYWLPLTIKIIIVAVPVGETFSGWDNYINGCSTPAQPGSITGNANPTDGSSQTYSISEVSGATSYTWTLPSGWTGSSTTSSINTTVGSSGGTISVTANNGCGSGTARTLSVSVQSCKPAQPGAISGNTSPEPGSSHTYSISEVSGATSYTWTLPAGWTGSSTTSSINATVGSSGGTISVTANNGCGSSTAKTLSVSVAGCSTPDQPGTISGNTSPAQGSSQTYSIADVSGATSYTWSLPAGWTGSSTSSSINATVGSSGGTLSVTANNTCGSSTARNLSVSVGCENPVTQPTPTYAINYGYERTNKVVPATDEYSYNSNMSGAQNGNGSYLYLTPGQDVYFRTKGLNNCVIASDIQHLDVPARQVLSSTYSINYVNETTNESVSSTVAYSTSPSLPVIINGTGSPVSVTPGQDLYFYVLPTASAFCSWPPYHLTVPARPAVPSITINYTTEVTSSVSTSQEWSTSASMSGAAAGTNTGIPVTPGTDLYFRNKATASAFISGIQSLDVPNRPAAPVYHIDYATEKTSEAVPATVDYSTHSDMSASTAGSGAAITLTPGTDLYFRTKPTGSSFKSSVSTLQIPVRPSLVYSGAATVTQPTITMRADLDPGMTGFDLTDLSVTNGTAQNLRENNTFDVIGQDKGDVKVIIPYNKFGGASFVSNEVVVYYDKTVTGLNEFTNKEFLLYPNPSPNGILYFRTELKAPFRVEVLSGNGSLVKSISVTDENTHELNLQDLKKGIYYLKFHMVNNTSIEKVVLE
jgi:hypothetical protein